MSPAAFDRVVADRASEADDLDFKGAWYRLSGPGNEQGEAAKDVCALANRQGGALIFGVEDEDATAARTKPVEIVDEDFRQLRQAIGNHVSPWIECETFFVPKAPGATAGFGVVLVPPSDRRPHALADPRDHRLRFPVRDGTRTRWLLEPELGDWYADRYRRASPDDRIDDWLSVGRRSRDSRRAWIVVALVPSHPGTMTVDHPAIQRTKQWFAGLDLSPWLPMPFAVASVTPAPRRFVVGPSHTGHQRGALGVLGHDGSGYFALEVFTALDEADATHEIVDDVVGRALFVGVRAAVLHAVENGGCWGDAAIEATFESDIRDAKPLRLVIRDEAGNGYVESAGPQFSASPHIASSPRAIRLEESLSHAGIMESVRALGSELVQHMGLAEIRQVDASGALRLKAISTNDRAAARAWCESRDVSSSEDDVDVVFSY
jgi:hypothetical protein